MAAATDGASTNAPQTKRACGSESHKQAVAPLRGEGRIELLPAALAAVKSPRAPSARKKGAS